ncbi:MAG: DNA methyltransferase [Chloroflexota bacterium]|nr:DNA methyltransferase [Chloroflexota bacterium]
MAALEQQLGAFVGYWRQHVRGDEKGEAQIFLDRLMQAFGYPDGIKGADGESEKRVKFTLHEKHPTRFADLALKGRALIEMKKRGEDLSKHYAQVLAYWLELPGEYPYMLLCNFDEIWVYDMQRQRNAPSAKVRIEQLPQQYGALAFLLPEPQAPIFSREFDLVELTDQAARSLSGVYISLTDKRHDRLETDVAQHFILQCMIALFAEDIGLLPRYTFTRVIEDCISGKDNSHDLLTLLFTFMDKPGKKRSGRFFEVDYFNGGIFRQVTPVILSSTELRGLRDAADHNWAKIHPAIFGRIFEFSMDKNARHQTGAHYSSEQDIRRIIEPVIERPWRAKIAAAGTAAELRALHAELCAYQVLDPACGSGNFLYLAYRGMKELENALLTRLRALEGDAYAQPAQSVSATQMHGFDINSFAVELAKVTLMIGKKLAVDDLHSPEAALPLDNLDSNIRTADALLTDWPAFDACIGNPPYMGAKRLKQEYPAEYINRVRAAFPDVPGNADYCVYWFRKAHDLMQPGTRAGLVGTNTIRQNYSRVGGLDHIVANDGHIFEAVSSLPWSGEAAVHVSIACWSKGAPPQTPILWLKDGTEALPVSTINSSLSVNVDVSEAAVLTVNREPKRAFQGLTPGHDAFVLEVGEARSLNKASPVSKAVIHPYMTGQDLMSQPMAQPRRYLIDLNEFDIVDAQAYGEAFKRIERVVLPVRQEKARAEAESNRIALVANPRASINTSHQTFLENWWKHSFTRVTFTAAIKSMSRYVICSRVSKRAIFDFVDPRIRISDKVQAFLFEDDYSYGVLQSQLHWIWWLERGATLKSDPAYTTNSIFDTFPFPQQPSPARVKAVADAGRALHEWRRAQMARDPKLTLRALYKTTELPGKNPLKDLHAALDTAVLAAYGFDAAGDVLAQLLALNQTVYARIQSGEPVTAPGIPADYPAPAELVSEGCIMPPAWE